MAEKKHTAPVRDVNQVIRYLTHTFNMATSSLDKANNNINTGPNQLYQYQTEFAYRLNEVTLGPPSLLPKHIAECNEYIDEVMQELNANQNKHDY